MRPILAALTLLSVVLAAGCASAPPAEPHVVLISVDGLAADYFEDPRAQLDAVRGLAAEGAHAEAMITSFPSVTWPSHTSLVTGASPAKHGIIGNSVLDRATGEQVRYIGDAVFSKDECVRVQTLYDAAHAAGMTTALIIWPATREAKTIDWNIPDVPAHELDGMITPGLADELDAAGISIRKLAPWGWAHDSASMRDRVYTRTAVHLLEKHQPNLVLIHLVTPDAFEHDFGPQTEEAYWAVSDSDDRIRQIWEALQSGPLAGSSDLFVVSDHGFAPVDKQILLNVRLREMGLIVEDRQGKVTGRKAFAHSSGGSAGIYIFDRENLETTRAEVKKALSEIEGVAQVLEPEEFIKLGLPDPESNTQQADLMVSAKSGYGFSGSLEGTVVIVDAESRTGSHGHLPTEPFMHATFVAAGTHIKPGVKLGEISNLDVAPTIAKILGLDLPEAEGQALTEILK